MPRLHGYCRTCDHYGTDCVCPDEHGRVSSYHYVYGPYDTLPKLRKGLTRYYIGLYDARTEGEVRVIADATTPEEAVTMAEREGIDYDEAHVTVEGFDGPGIAGYGPREENEQ